MANIKLKVYSYDPSVDSEPYYSDYEVPKPEVGSMTVLNALEYVLANLDGTLSFYHSCDGGRCGGCGAVINSKPGLMCKVYAEDDVVVEPLKNFVVVKDLVADIGRASIRMTQTAQAEVPEGDKE